MIPRDLRFLVAAPLVATLAPGAVVFAADTTWTRVHLPGMSPCSPADVQGSSPTQTVEHVWCFEGAGGDSTWPAGVGGFYHWSRFDPPGPQPSRWHVSTRHGGPGTGTFSAWAGCDSVGTNPACDDVNFWIFQDGYGDDWDYSLILNLRDQDASLGATLTFDLRFDTEMSYDYLFVEREGPVGTWTLIDSFDGVSGGGPHGGSVWLTGLSYAIPPYAGGLRIRWRAVSDFVVSDQDGRLDTDGLAAIDNVSVVFAATGSVVSDDFETGDFLGIVSTQSSASWQPRSLAGSEYDGWHLVFDPAYQNKGNTCSFSDDWMWAARPDANGFDFLLVSPAIDVQGWTGGVIEYSSYYCLPPGTEDIAQRLVRFHDTADGWSVWNDYRYELIGGCSDWSFNEQMDLTDWLGTGVDSLQVAWEVLDLSEPGGLTWGNHLDVQVLVDNVSIGRFDGTVTSFDARPIDLFADTFSRSDPAHTPFLDNASQGNWSGTGGSFDFAAQDSLSVFVRDTDGISEGNVLLWWRHDDGAGTFGSWESVTMDLSLRDLGSATDEGMYRAIIGKDDGGVEDLTPAGDHLIWLPGTTVEYYVAATDDIALTTTYPESGVLEFSVLPFFRTGPAQNGETYLLVDDWRRSTLDFENSTGYDPDVGGGVGGFSDPVFVPADALVESALERLGLEFDRYDVQGPGTSVEAEPRGLSNSGAGVGGYLDDSGNPLYDCVIWLQGAGAFQPLQGTTRNELRMLLDHGGNLLATGDALASDLGPEDVEFVRRYLGTEPPPSAATEARILNVSGEAGTSLDGVTLGLFGNCPGRRWFDRLQLVTPDTSHTNGVLAVYTAGGPGDEGKPAAIANQRTVGGGRSVVAGFGPGALISEASRACLLESVLGGQFGLTIPVSSGCVNSGVGAPVTEAARHDFALRGARPNPFRASTGIEFAIAQRGRVTVALYDVAGRRIRTLVDEGMEPGAYVRTWDGRTDTGEQAVSGIYFVRLISGDLEERAKIVRLR